MGDHADDAELLTPILCAISMQLIAYYIALRLRRDVDQPRNLPNP